MDRQTGRTAERATLVISVHRHRALFHLARQRLAIIVRPNTALGSGAYFCFTRRLFEADTKTHQSYTEHGRSLRMRSIVVNQATTLVARTPRAACLLERNGMAPFFPCAPNPLDNEQTGINCCKQEFHQQPGLGRLLVKLRFSPITNQGPGHSSGCRNAKQFVEDPSASYHITSASSAQKARTPVVPRSLARSRPPTSMTPKSSLRHP